MRWTRQKIIVGACAAIAAIGLAVALVGSRGHGGLADSRLGSVSWQVACHGQRRVVVGSRGLVGLQGMSLGSVVGALVHHSPCPVAVVYPAAR